MSSKTTVFLVTALVAALAGFGPSSPVSAQQDRQPHHGQLKNTAKPPPQGRSFARPPPQGREVRTLPGGNQTVRVGRTDYRYRDGVFYRPRPSGGFVVVGAPIGARIRYLPFGYVSFWIGPQRYFYWNYAYYLWDPRFSEYVVVAQPEGADKAVATATETGSASGEVFVYPKEGQSDEQRDRDRYECYVWAVDQTGFDPTAGNADTSKAGDYRRALSACLEGRGYTVK